MRRDRRRQSRFFGSSRVAGGALLGVLALTGCGPSLTTAEQTARYFALKDAVTFSYENSAGLVEEHSYSDTSGDDLDNLSFKRVARRGGFVEDDHTFDLQVTGGTVLISQFYDCLTRCAKPSEPVAMVNFPLEGGQAEETEVDVEYSVNGSVTETRREKHRFVVGEEAEFDVPAGNFTGHEVLWTKTVDDTTETARFVAVADTGFVEVESFGGVAFSLTTVPDLSEDED